MATPQVQTSKTKARPKAKKPDGGNGKGGFGINPNDLIPMEDDPDFAEF